MLDPDEPMPLRSVPVVVPPLLGRPLDIVPLVPGAPVEFGLTPEVPVAVLGVLPDDMPELPLPLVVPLPMLPPLPLPPVPVLPGAMSRLPLPVEPDVPVPEPEPVGGVVVPCVVVPEPVDPEGDVPEVCATASVAKRAAHAVETIPKVRIRVFMKFSI